MSRSRRVYSDRWLRVTVVAMMAAVAMSFGCGEDPVVPPATSPVAGRVVDSAGNPVEGVVVLVGDKPAVTSDAQGAFQVEGVGATYDATVLGPARVDAFKGLTRRDPVFRVAVPGRSNTARIRGTVPVAGDRVTGVYFTPNDVAVPVFASPLGGQYSLSVFWTGPPTITGTFHVVRWTMGGDGLPVEYDGFASRSLVLVDGETTDNVDFSPENLADPPEARISGTVQIPGGYELSSISIAAIHAGGTFYLLQESRLANPASTFEYIVPGVADLTCEIEAFAFEGTRHTVVSQRAIVPPATGISLDLPPAPQVIQPAPDATDVGYDTPFQWAEGGAPGVYALYILGEPDFTIWLMGTSTTIPDLSDHGLGLAPASNYDWMLYKVFPLSAVDEVVGPEPWRQAVGAETGDVHSETYRFTTHPE